MITGIAVIELDRHFWSDDLAPLATETWIHVQEQLTLGDQWIMDGDLGPYDAPAARLRKADTVVVLDISLVRCAWRAARRSRERADFWWWLLAWRWRSRPKVFSAIDAHTPHADLQVLRTPAQIRRFLASASTLAT